MRPGEIEVPMRVGNVEVGAPALITSPPGWRVALVGPDQDHEACPVVAWGREGDSLVPYARVHGQDGYCAVMRWAGDEERAVGLLAPGEEFDQGWLEACERHAEALREAQDRSERAS